MRTALEQLQALVAGHREPDEPDSTTNAAYLASIALTVEMTDACQALANVSPPLDRAAWEAAHARYCRKADEVKAWYRATLPVDPALAHEMNESLKARMEAIRHEWRARQKGGAV